MNVPKTIRYRGQHYVLAATPITIPTGLPDWRQPQGKPVKPAAVPDAVKQILVAMRITEYLALKNGAAYTILFRTRVGVTKDMARAMKKAEKRVNWAYYMSTAGGVAGDLLRLIFRPGTPPPKGQDLRD